MDILDYIKMHDTFYYYVAYGEHVEEWDIILGEEINA